METKQILFNTDMVQAILDGRKTVTRRVVKPQPEEATMYIELANHYPIFAVASTPDAINRYNPPYQPGDILYVRETFFKHREKYYYKADKTRLNRLLELSEDKLFKWRPSIHMPKEAARIFLRVTDVRVERLQDITAEQVLDEGVDVEFPDQKPGYVSLAYTEMRLKPAVRKQFADIWDRTIKPADRAIYGWDTNPWVWVIDFERISMEDVNDEVYGPKDW